MHMSVVKEKSVTTAGSSGRALGQAGTSGSSYRKRHLICVHCYHELQQRRLFGLSSYSSRYSMNQEHARTHAHTAHTHTSTHTHARTHPHTHAAHMHTIPSCFDR